jgi:hypothetical protein
VTLSGAQFSLELSDLNVLLVDPLPPGGDQVLESRISSWLRFIHSISLVLDIRSAATAHATAAPDTVPCATSTGGLRAEADAYVRTSVGKSRRPQRRPGRWPRSHPGPFHRMLAAPTPRSVGVHRSIAGAPRSSGSTPLVSCAEGAASRCAPGRRPLRQWATTPQRCCSCVHETVLDPGSIASSRRSASRQAGAWPKAATARRRLRSRATDRLGARRGRQVAKGRESDSCPAPARGRTEPRRACGAEDRVSPRGLGGFRRTSYEPCRTAPR